MTQEERRIFLIEHLLSEKQEYKDIAIPVSVDEQKMLLRGLMNIREPKSIGEDFIAIQDEYLQEEIALKGITDIESLPALSDGIYLWQGDITTLRSDAIVNAANSALTGCYKPCHACIDNAIHTYAGVQLRLECARQIAGQGHEEETGKAKITRAYNLPCKFILHTVGPIISGRVRKEDEELLSSCYRSCLSLARRNGIKSIAFCCISTGEFHFPARLAAEIAVKTVRKHKGSMDVIFNVFKDSDYEIYRNILT